MCARGAHAVNVNLDTCPRATSSLGCVPPTTTETLKSIVDVSCFLTWNHPAQAPHRTPAITERCSTAPRAALALSLSVGAMAMRSLPLLGDESPITWAGSLTQEVTPDGSVRPWRLPHGDAALCAETCRALRQSPRRRKSGGALLLTCVRVLCRYEGTHNGAAGLFNLAGMAAGVRITFLTTAEQLELTVCSRACGPDTKIDLCIGNDLLESKNIGAVAFGGGTPEQQAQWAATWSAPTTLTFSGLSRGQKRVELWLPHVGICKIVSVAIPSTAQASRFVDTRPRWTTYGSSISHCGEAYSPARTWPATCARLADLNLYCLGFGGNCNLDPMVARAIRDHPADCINLKLGINMMASHNKRTFIPSVIGFIATIRDGQPTTPIVVTSPIFSTPRETKVAEVFQTTPDDFQSNHAFTLSQFREALADMVRVLRERGDSNIHVRLAVIQPRAVPRLNGSIPRRALRPACFGGVTGN